MSEQNLEITLDMIDEYDWVALCDTSTEDSILHFYSIFNKAEGIAKASGELHKASFYTLLARVSSMYYKYDDNDPFGALMETQQGRTALVEDFTEADQEIFKHLLNKSGKSVIDARLADTLWLLKKDRMHAELALENYLNHVSFNLKINQDKWIYGFESLDRSCRLWRQLGRPEVFTQKLMAIIKFCLNEEEHEPVDSFRLKILKLALEFKLVPEGSNFQVWSEKLANETFKIGEFDKAKKYLKLSIDFSIQNKDIVEQKRLKRLLIDFYINEARTLKEKGASSLQLADSFSKAIEAARRHGGLRDLIDELHLEMNSVQEKALLELSPINVTIDVTKLVQEGREAINSVPVEQALSQIAILAKPWAMDEIRDTVEKLAREYPLRHTIGAMIFNEKGRVVARSSGVLSSVQTEREAGILAQMLF